MRAFSLILSSLIATGSLAGCTPPIENEFADEEPNLLLVSDPSEQELLTDENGQWQFVMSITITNIGNEAEPVPVVLVLGRDSHDRILMRKRVEIEQESIAIGDSLDMTAQFVVPQRAKIFEIGWASEQ